MNRGNIATLAFFVLCVGGAAGMLLTGWSPNQTEERHPWPTAVSTQAPRPTPAPFTIGSTGNLMADIDSVLFVDQLGLWAWNRAYANRDDKGEAQVMALYDHLRLAPNTAIRVTNLQGDAAQVEIISGYSTGRRGWIDVSTLHRLSDHP